MEAAVLSAYYLSLTVAGARISADLLGRDYAVESTQ